MDLILHPGNAKCGSSSIQGFIANHIKQLQMLGIGVVNCNFKLTVQADSPRAQYAADLVNAGKFIRFLERNMEPKREFDKACSQLIKTGKKKGLKTIIISSERLGFAHEEKLEVFHEILSNKFENIKVLYYIRRQDEIFLSMWQERFFRKGLTYKEADLKGFLHQHSDFTRTLSILERNYGKKNIQVRPISKTALTNRDLISDFIERTGIKLNRSIPPEYKRTNISLNPVLCDVLSRIRINKKGSLESFKEHLEFLTKDKNLIYKKCENFLSIKQRNEILARYEVSNRSIHRNYFPQLDFDQEFGFIYDSYKYDSSRQTDQLEHLKDVLAIITSATLALQNQLDLLKKHHNKQKASHFFIKKSQRAIF